VSSVAYNQCLEDIQVNINVRYRRGFNMLKMEENISEMHSDGSFDGTICFAIDGGLVDGVEGKVRRLTIYIMSDHLAIKCITVPADYNPLDAEDLQVRYTVENEIVKSMWAPDGNTVLPFIEDDGN